MPVFSDKTFTAVCFAMLADISPKLTSTSEYTTLILCTMYVCVCVCVTSHAMASESVDNAEMVSYCC